MSFKISPLNLIPSVDDSARSTWITFLGIRYCKFYAAKEGRVVEVFSGGGGGGGCHRRRCDMNT